MEAAMKVLRMGFLPYWTDETILRLLTALEADDPLLVQEVTCIPLPLPTNYNQQVEGLCPIAFCSVSNPSNVTVGTAEILFANACATANEVMGKPYSHCRFLEWYDNTPRAEAFAALAAEIKDELSRRKGQ